MGVYRVADEVSTAVTSAWIVPFARAIPSAQSRALVMLWLRLPGWRRRPRFRARPCRGTSASRRTAARPRRARGGSSVRVVGEGLLEEANLALKQRFAVRPVRRSRRPRDRRVRGSRRVGRRFPSRPRALQSCPQPRLEDGQPPRLAGVLTPPPRTDATAEQVCPTVDV